MQSTARPAATAQDKFDRFEVWLKENGAGFEQVSERH